MLDVDIYLFKHKANIDNEFYLKIAHDGKMSFIVIENDYIFSSLDLVSVLKTNMKTESISVKTIDVSDFPALNINKNPVTYSKMVTLNKNLKYTDDLSIVFVSGENNFNYIPNILSIEYLNSDSDRHKEKDKLNFIIDIDKGIYSINNDHFLYVDKTVFKKYNIIKL